MENWNDSSMTYSDGANSVKVSGVSTVTLRFGGDISELPAGAFSDAFTAKIFEETPAGMLA
jgi:hypothetical protein